MPKVKQKEIESCYIRTLWQCSKRHNLHTAACTCTPVCNIERQCFTQKIIIPTAQIISIAQTSGWNKWLHAGATLSTGVEKSTPGQSILQLAPEEELLLSQWLQLSYHDEHVTTNELWKTT